MQLHASHSTPSLDTIAAAQLSSPNVAGSSCLAAGPSLSSQQRNSDSKAFDINKANSRIDIHVNTAEVAFAPVATLANPASDQSKSNAHHVTSPSFPIIVTGTPSTPSLIPTDPLPHQGSHALFSPHQPIHGGELLTHHQSEASQSSGLRPSRANLSVPKYNMEADDIQGLADLARRSLSLSEQMSQRSVSLGSCLLCILFITSSTLHHFLPCLIPLWSACLPSAVPHSCE